MNDPVITDQGEQVVTELLYLSHGHPVLTEVESVDDALNRAEWIEDEGSGSTVAVLVAGAPRHVHGPETRYEWRPAGEVPHLADKALVLAARARAYEAEAERRHGAQLRRAR